MTEYSAKPGTRTPQHAELQFAAPRLNYLPQNPKNYRAQIGLIGCGDITVEHLTAYKNAGYEVVALCDIDQSRAESRRKKFYPKATVYTDHLKLLADANIDVVDIATHPPARPPLIRDALEAGKHVLSQKPFVIDLEVGRRLADFADAHNTKLAVNQNGRWAPHFSYLRNAVGQGLVGEVVAAHMHVAWDHNWVRGTPFDKIRHLILYDFGIHWFDMLACLISDREPLRVYASFTRSATQQAQPAMLAQVIVEYEDAQASLVFDGDTRHGPRDTTTVIGSKGTLYSLGADFHQQRVELHTEQGIARPELTGDWFPDGFHGAMGELLCAIEQKREPTNNARNNLNSLALCFAAVQSAEQHRPIPPSEVQKLCDT